MTRKQRGAFAGTRLLGFQGAGANRAGEVAGMKTQYCVDGGCRVARDLGWMRC